MRADAEGTHNRILTTPVDLGSVRKSESPWTRGFRLFRRNRTATTGALIILLAFIAAAIPVSWLPHDPYITNIRYRFVPPYWAEEGTTEYLLGTDALGRDVLSTIIHGTRFSLLIIISSAFTSLVIGVTAGLIAGYYRGWLDELIMRFVDIQLAFPVLILVIALVAMLGPSIRNLIIVIGITGWAAYARLVRGVVLSIREKEYFESARSAGATDLRIIFYHLLPNTITPIVVFVSFDLARLMLTESALSFLGLGVQPPTPSWGAMIADGRQHLFEAWWTSALPGLAIVITVMAFNLMGDGLRDAFDPMSYD